MLPQDMLALGTKRSVMRELYEYGLSRAEKIGGENVLDFSLGNPSVPPPPAVNDCIRALVEGAPSGGLHGYTSAPGDLGCRRNLAASLTGRFGGPYGAEDLYLTVGAAAALCCVLRAISCPGDECVVLAPYFPEYLVFIAQNGGVPLVVPPDYDSFLPDMAALEAALSPRTKAVLLNSPNNPSGVVYPAETLARMADMLRRKAAEYDHPIYLISDEPYREIVYPGHRCPWVPALYENTIVCYSYSKSLSLPGERIGYILLPKSVAEHDLVYAALCGAGRALGYVNAPALFQRVAAACDGLTADLSVYQTNRDLLYRGLTDMGYRCIEPGGTFYLLLKSPEADAQEFCERAKARDLILPPADDFGIPGYCRLAFCTTTEKVKKSLPIFRELR